MNMTPEERLNRMDDVLDRLLRCEEQSYARHIAWRSVDGAGLRRIDDCVLDPQAQTESLLAALLSSQVRTDESLRAVQESVRRLTDTFQSYLESRKLKDDHPLQT